MYSKPCHGCECHISKLMRLYGLKRVFYSWLIFYKLLKNIPNEYIILPPYFYVLNPYYLMS
jgi:hypothetical protein